MLNPNYIVKRLLQALPLSVLAVSLFSYSLPVAAQVMTSPDPPKVEVIQKLDSQVPLDLAFVDESGKSVVLRDLINDKPVVLALVYYECPMLCGEVMQGMVKVFNELDYTIGKEFEVITVSFDPREKPELASLKKQNTLEAYKHPEAKAGWHFLTTDKEENVRTLAETVGFQYLYLPSVNQFAHGSAIMVITPKGRVSRYFYGIEYPERDVRFGLMEAADERIGSLADEIQLLCFRYDPASGSYGFVVMSAIRLGGVVTVAFLALLIGTMLVQERLRKGKRASGQPLATP